MTVASLLPVHERPGAPPDAAAYRRAPVAGGHPLLRLQRLAGNAAVAGALRRPAPAPAAPVQRDGPDAGAPAQATAGGPLEQVEQALNHPDEVAGVGDYPAAWRILNGLSMADLLATLTALKRNGRLELLAANTGAMTGVDRPRLLGALHTVQLGSGQVTNDLIVTTAGEVQQLPADQGELIVRHLAGGGSAQASMTMEGVAAIVGGAALNTPIPPQVLASVTGPVGPGPWSPPGRQPIPFYIGNEAHAGIAAEYVAAHPGQLVFANSVPMTSILAAVGKTAAVLGAGADLRPDIANVSPAKRQLYEIKPVGAESVAVAKAVMYQGLFATAGYPMTLGPTGEPGTSGVVPAPAGYYVFSSPVPGAITYRYRRGQYQPVPVTSPAPEEESEGSDLRLRLPPLSPQQQQVLVVNTTAATLMLLIMVIILLPVGV